MQILKTGILLPDDAFSLTDFDVVYHDRKLGKGGYGTVYEGNWHGMKVAIKQIVNFHPAVSRDCQGLTWGFPGQPAPVPQETRTRSQGCGFWGVRVRF